MDDASEILVLFAIPHFAYCALKRQRWNLVYTLSQR